MDAKESNVSVHAMRALMENEKVTLGSFVELWLHEKTGLNVETTTVPTYYLGDTGKPRSCAGYICEFADAHISLLPVSGAEAGKNPDQGHVGGINVAWDAIKSYRILSRRVL